MPHAIDSNSDGHGGWHRLDALAVVRPQQGELALLTRRRVHTSGPILHVYHQAGRTAWRVMVDIGERVEYADGSLAPIGHGCLVRWDAGRKQWVETTQGEVADLAERGRP